MYQYRRLLVGLNLSSQDETTLRYAAFVARMARSERVYFVHVAETLDVPPEVREAFPDAVQPADEAICAEMEAAAGRFFDAPPETERVFAAAEGSVAVELLRRAVRKDADLVVVGCRPKARGGGTVPEKLARKAPCSVLIVPEGAEPRLRRVLIPVDFSTHAADAVEVAVAFGAASGAELLPLHVYHVPLGYYKAGKSFEEFAAIVRGHAEARYARFVAELDLQGLPATPLFELEEKPARAIREAEARHAVDLVVMGARGRTNSAAVLLGSVTERVLLDTQVPLVAVKRKGDTLTFLEAVLEL